MNTSTFPPSATVADLGEFDLIDALVARFPQGEQVYLGPGDDAALIRTPRGHVVFSADMAVQDRHFRLEWASAAAIGARAAAANLADIAAMGGTAHSLTVSLALPDTTLASWVIDLADGIAGECAKVGACVVGGDLTRADQVVIAISVLGTCERAPVVRSGAQPGDVLALAGRQGWAAAGLAVLGRGFRSPRVVVEGYQSPQPPYAAGPLAAQAGATAMLDVSDGLIADARHLAAASRVDLALESSAFTVAEPLQAVGAAIGVDPMTFILEVGDDHALLASFPASVTLPDPFVVIGAVSAGTGQVSVDGSVVTTVGGWRHF